MTTKIKQALIYVGSVGALISAVAYIIVTIVLILGFETSMSAWQQGLFSFIGAVAGLSITVMLREQGIALASNEVEPKKIMKEYRALLNKEKPLKKLHMINYHRIIHLILDTIFKMLSIAFMTYFILYIFIEGSGDYGLIGLAIANIFLFISFGLLALARAYDFYIEEHIPAVLERIEKIHQARLIALEREKHARLQRSEVPDTSTTSVEEQERHRDTPKQPSGHLELNQQE